MKLLSLVFFTSVFTVKSFAGNGAITNSIDNLMFKLSNDRVGIAVESDDFESVLELLRARLAEGDLPYSGDEIVLFDKQALQTGNKRLRMQNILNKYDLSKFKASEPNSVKVETFELDSGKIVTVRTHK